MAASLFLVFCYVERVFMNIVEFLKVLVFSLVEGFTEWLPISSTGHLILLQDIIPLGGSKDFFSTFEVLIQLGAVFAVWQKKEGKRNLSQGRPGDFNRKDTPCLLTCGGSRITLGRFSGQISL